MRSKLLKLRLSMFNSGEVDAIELIYTHFASTISQVATSLKLLPIEQPEAKEIGDEPVDFINYEPSPEEVLNFVVPKYVESTIYGGLIESAASEQAARRVAMESASDNAQEYYRRIGSFV